MHPKTVASNAPGIEKWRLATQASISASPEMAYTPLSPLGNIIESTDRRQWMEEVIGLGNA